VLPRVTGFTPGSAAVGATVTIFGNAFGGATSVLFNGVSAVPGTVLPTKITVPVQADASTGKLTVVTAAGAGLSGATFHVLPKVTSFSPGSGVVGTTVTISGTGFTDVTAVKFNGRAATTWTRDSSIQISAMVPLGATTGRITVTTAGGTATSATNFTVVP
jgi:IPT/TIG domain